MWIIQFLKNGNLMGAKGRLYSGARLTQPVKVMLRMALSSEKRESFMVPPGVER